MHDIHAANEILNLVLAEAKKQNWQKIEKIKLELGQVLEHGAILSAENLAYNIKLLAKRGPARGLKVEIVPGQSGAWKLVEIEGE